MSYTVFIIEHIIHLMNKSKIQSFVYRVHKNILILNFICLVQKKKVRKKMKECLYWQELNL